MSSLEGASLFTRTLTFGSQSSLRSSGLGLATVSDLLSKQAYVSIVDRAPPPDDILASPNVKFIKTDITILAEISAAVAASVQWAASTNAPLGGVINCAGVGTAAKIIDSHNKAHNLEIWEFTLAVNLTGSFNLTRLVLEHLVQVQPEPGPDGERGIVIFVASAAAVSYPNNIYFALLTESSHSSKGSPGRPHMPPRKAPCGP